MREQRGERSGGCSSRCATSRSSATCAAPGYFHAIELVKDKDTKETFDDEESETLLRGFLSGRAVPARADLPRRRPRRPGDPALAAADRRARAVRGDRVASCAPCSPRPASGCTCEARRRPVHPARRARRPGASDDADRPRAAAGSRRSPGRGEEATRTCRSAGCTSRSCSTRRHGCPGGELLLTTGLQLDTARAPARVRRPPGRPPARRARVRDRASGTRPCPRRVTEVAERARVPGVRGALRGAVHRDHRGGVHASSSTSSTRCFAARWPRRSGSSASCCPSAGWRRWSAALATLIGARGAGVRLARRAAHAARVPAHDRADGGGVAAGRDRERARRREARAFMPPVDDGHRALALPVAIRRGAQAGSPGPVRVPEAWLVAIKDSGAAVGLRPSDAAPGGHDRRPGAPARAGGGRHRAPAGRRRARRGGSRRARRRRACAAAGAVRPG